MHFNFVTEDFDMKHFTEVEMFGHCTLIIQILWARPAPAGKCRVCDFVVN